MVKLCQGLLYSPSKGTEFFLHVNDLGTVIFSLHSQQAIVIGKRHLRLAFSLIKIVLFD